MIRLTRTGRRMGELEGQAEWYYVGHYGQLGPLTLEQIQELANDGVVAAETYVWKPGLVDWRPARDVSELRQAFGPVGFDLLPPPAPGLAATPRVAQAMPVMGHSASWAYLQTAAPKSDKSRVTAGLLNLIPGMGRFYLGYAAHGALQLFTALFCLVGFFWSVVDGLYILLGGVKFDGYGRTLQD